MVLPLESSLNLSRSPVGNKEHIASNKRSLSAESRSPDIVPPPLLGDVSTINKITNQRDLCGDVIAQALNIDDPSSMEALVDTFMNADFYSGVDRTYFEETVNLLLEINLSLAHLDAVIEEPTFTDTTCEDLGVQRVIVPGDGNCLYESLSKGLSFSAAELRTKVSDKANEKSDRYFKLFGTEKDDVINTIQEDQSWAGNPGDISAQLALQCVADEEGRSVTVINSLLNTVLTISPSNSSGEIDKEPVIVIYNGFNHYDAVTERDPDIPVPTPVVPSRVDLEAAKKTIKLDLQALAVTPEEGVVPEEVVVLEKSAKKTTSHLMTFLGNKRERTQKACIAHLLNRDNPVLRNYAGMAPKDANSLVVAMLRDFQPEARNEEEKKAVKSIIADLMFEPKFSIFNFYRNKSLLNISYFYKKISQLKEGETCLVESGWDGVKRSGHSIGVTFKREGDKINYTINNMWGDQYEKSFDVDITSFKKNGKKALKLLFKHLNGGGEERTDDSEAALKTIYEDVATVLDAKGTANTAVPFFRQKGGYCSIASKIGSIGSHENISFTKFERQYLKQLYGFLQTKTSSTPHDVEWDTMANLVRGALMDAGGTLEAP